MRSKLSFQTSSVGDQNPTERFVINSAGISTFFNDVTIDRRGVTPASMSDLTISKHINLWRGAVHIFI